MAIHAPVMLPTPAHVLAGRPTVTAHSADEAHETISALFCEHELRPLDRRPVRMSLRSVHAQDAGIEMLDYGVPVRISPVGLGDFHLVQIPLSGRATLSVGAGEVHSTPRIASLPPIDRPSTMTWEADTPQLIVYLRRTALARAAASLYGFSVMDTLDLAPRMDLAAPGGQAFLRAAFELHDALTAPHGTGFAQRLAAETVAARLLLAVENSAGRSLAAWESAEVAVEGGGGVLLRRFTELVESHFAEELGVLDIAEALGVPLRTLQELVRRETGSTPSRILQDARLRRAHTLLRRADPSAETVTAVAERCGFAHLGRFAASYRSRFGESPSETLRG